MGRDIIGAEEKEGMSQYKCELPNQLTKERKANSYIIRDQRRSRNWMMVEMYDESTVDSPKSSATELMTSKRPRSASCSAAGTIDPLGP